MGPIGKFNDIAEEQVLEVIKIHAIYSIVLILIYCLKNKVQIFSLAFNNVDEFYQAASFVFFSPYSVLQSDCAIQSYRIPTFSLLWVLVNAVHSVQSPSCQFISSKFCLNVRAHFWGRKWQPTPVFQPGKSHKQRSPVRYSPWGHRLSDMGGTWLSD